MENCEELLYCFIKEKIPFDKQEEFIIKTNLSTICLQFFENSESLINNGILKLLAQKKANMIYEKEILKINNIFEKEGLDVVFIKGLPLAEELYSKRETRLSGDIDILISKNNLEKSLELLGELGYYIKEDVTLLNSGNKDMVSYSVLEKYIPEFDGEKQHFPVFSRTLDNNIQIALDCHLCVFQFLSNKFEKMEHMIKRSVLQAFHGKNIHTLQLYDKLVHLIFHFVKETTRDDVFWAITGWKQARYYPKLNLIHDIALLISKNNEFIHWQDLLERAIYYEKVPEISFTARILCFIYPGLIPEYFIKKLNNVITYKDDSFSHTVLRALERMDIDDFILHNGCQLIGKIIGKINYIGDSVDVSNGKNYFYIKSPAYYINKTKSFGVKPYNTNYAVGKIQINESCFEISLIIYKNYISCKYLPVVSFFMSNYNFIEKYACYTPRFQIVLDKTDNKISARLLANRIEVLQNNFCNVKLNQELSLDICINWNIVGFSKAKEMLFNIEIDERNEEGNTIRYPSEFMNRFDIKYFGIIK